MRFIYGPVPSRRLGLSLGVDLVPRKVCCYDCVYCQLGGTTRQTTEPERFVDVDPDVVVREVERALSRPPRPQVITLAGSGEPTLEEGLAPIIAGLKRVTDLPLCLLTGGGLLWREVVRATAARCDRVFPSLDAADPQTFARVNRPPSDLDHARVLEGLRAFCRGYRGRCRLEVMLVRGVNDDDASLDALARLIRSLENLEGVDLNTVVRPPACVVERVSAETLQKAHERDFGCPVAIIAPYVSSSLPLNKTHEDLRRRILELVSRRPCTLEDLAQALGLPLGVAREVCARAVQRGELEEEPRPAEDGRDLYYRIASPRAVEEP